MRSSMKILQVKGKHFSAEVTPGDKLRVRFGDPDHDRVLRTKTWSGAKTTWSS